MLRINVAIVFNLLVLVLSIAVSEQADNFLSDELVRAIRGWQPSFTHLSAAPFSATIAGILGIFTLVYAAIAWTLVYKGLRTEDRQSKFWNLKKCFLSPL